jgi:hypothetical protein
MPRLSLYELKFHPSTLVGITDGPEPSPPPTCLGSRPLLQTLCRRIRVSADLIYVCLSSRTLKANIYISFDNSPTPMPETQFDYPYDIDINNEKAFVDRACVMAPAT